MKKEVQINGNRVYLRSVKISDVTKEYVSWLNSNQINQFLESRFMKHNLSSTKKYIQKIKNNENFIFLAIIRKDNEKHIGNIKIGPIDEQHKIGEIGLMIGDKKSWGKGFATDAIKTLTEYAFEDLKLHKVFAGVYQNNMGSIKAFQKVGFFIEGNRKKHYLYKNEYVDLVLLGKINSS